MEATTPATAATAEAPAEAETLDDLGRITYQYREGFPLNEAEPGLGNLLLYLREIAVDLSLASIPFGLLGLAVLWRRDPLRTALVVTFPALLLLQMSSQKAYRQAGVRPEELDLFEVHDAFTIMSALSLEAAGFARRGEGWRLAHEGAIGINGDLPVSTMGGLKSRGHPVGATGVYQIVEVVQQLSGRAGANQVPHARLGMAQNIGGSGATIVTHILGV